MDGAAPVAEGSEANPGASPRTISPIPAEAAAALPPEFLCPPPVRSAADAGDSAAAAASGVVKEKKSRRQMKRERKEEQKSTLHICIEVARSGNVDSCNYGDKCRFSHDINAYLAQKPADFEGTCPFINVEESCPYGLTCRFLNSHKENIPSESQKFSRKSHEINGLSKNLQKLLWKNKVDFPKADAQLKLLGLKGGKSKKEKSKVDNVENQQDAFDGSNNLCNDDKSEMLACKDDDASCVDVSDEARPLKKTKGEVAENGGNDIANGSCCMETILTDGTENSSLNTLNSCKVNPSPKVHAREKKLIDFRGKLYLAPLTTVGNLPFRRICKVLGADVTCGEMAMCTNLLQGQVSEWALLRRHSSEDLFGVQICGAYPDTVARTVELVESQCSVDFIDINMGCPIDIIVNKGAGSSLLMKPMRMKGIIQAASNTFEKPLTVKVRTGYFEGRNRIDSLVSDIYEWGASALTIHGRSRQQRYSKLADWDYIYQCARKAPSNLHVLGNGDVFSYTDWNKHASDCPELSSCMIARGALIKPWMFTEIKEQRHWDITSGERFNILKDFVRFGLEHWGSDTKGVETTRHFLLEWLSYTYRYIPVGLLDVVPQRLNWRPPSFYGRDDLETLMASDSAADWIRISEMLLGKVPEGFTFAPKHKSNAYDRAENG
uniref:tRNA-dihydrouridine(47) synthase [NAD(P)(+)] n=1 Tax=Ananas comosus var. bracteatus TaxID=296719 RepID=A0A6V7QKF5_ANACO|nr:unnamed protein product [Ananas comosus var. bracteatus]